MSQILNLICGSFSFFSYNNVNIDKMREEGGVYTDLQFLIEYINPVILGICLIVGFCLKQAFTWFENRYIPLAAACLGTILSIVMNHGDVTASIILGGMMSGLASTGLYEMLKNLLRGKCHDGE